MTPRTRIAEAVLPGHPDKLADRVADEIVDRALALDPRAVVGAEVALFQDQVFLTGPVRTGGGAGGLDPEAVEDAVRCAYGAVGFGGTWGPDPASLVITSRMDHEPLTDEVRRDRVAAEDQVVVTGYAAGSEATRFLPLEQWLCRRLAARIGALREEHPQLALGPDGKLLLALEAREGAWIPATLSFSLHHAPRVDWVGLLRAVRGLVLEEFAAHARADPGLRLEEDHLEILLNPAGAFELGGPLGDNGLTGRKLVVDFYGPRVPIGGGALSGKDPRKVDRLGALRARHIARSMVETGLARTALVRLGWFPGEAEPRVFDVRVDGRALPARGSAIWRGRFDLSIEGTVRELGLDQTRYAPLASSGHFGVEGVGWEGGDVALSNHASARPLSSSPTRSAAPL